MRLAQLDEKINNKNKKGTKGKNKKVSEQVRKMLIKSRAVGNKKLRQEDRFYIDTVLWDETSVENDRYNGSIQQTMSSSFMFFSRVATVGKVISTTAGSLADSRDKGAELLALTSPVTSTSSKEDDNNKINSLVYRRIPPTLPLHDAESKGYFKNFERVIVRIFRAEPGASISSCYTESIN